MSAYFGIAETRLGRIMPETFHLLSPRMATFRERGAGALALLDLNTNGYPVHREVESNDRF